MSSLGRSAVMKALTVTDTSSGSWVSDRAVWTTWGKRRSSLETTRKAGDVYERKWDHVVLYLVDEWSSEGVALQQHTGPQVRVFAAHQVARQALEQGVLIANLKEKEHKLILFLHQFKVQHLMNGWNVLLTLISSWSHCPRSYATQAKWGSLFSQYFPTTRLS